MCFDILESLIETFSFSFFLKMQVSTRMMSEAFQSACKSTRIYVLIASFSWCVCVCVCVCACVCVCVCVCTYVCIHTYSVRKCVYQHTVNIRMYIYQDMCVTVEPGDTMYDVTLCMMM